MGNIFHLIVQIFLIIVGAIIAFVIDLQWTPGIWTAVGGFLLMILPIRMPGWVRSIGMGIVLGSNTILGMIQDWESRIQADIENK